MNHNNNRKIIGLTMVENLAVIVVVVFIVIITIIAYTEATDSSLQSDLTNASIELHLLQVENEKFPNTIDCNRPDSVTNHCIKASPVVMFSYQADNTASPQTFTLQATNGFIKYSISSDAPLKKLN